MGTHTIKTVNRKKKKITIKSLNDRYDLLKMRIENEKLIDEDTVKYLTYCIDSVFSIINHIKEENNLKDL